MTTGSRRGRILKVAVDSGSTVPLYRQIYDSIRRDITSGLLPPGARLPSTRFLAGDANVARSTVIQAYEQLRAEGYVDGILGAGTHVSRILPDVCVTPAAPRSSASVAPRRALRVSNRARDIARPPRLGTVGSPPRAFRVGVPAVDIFPMELWGRLLAKRWSLTASRYLAYGDPCGFLPLREAIADYLNAARGVRCGPGNVIVTAGSQQALDLVSRVLLDPGDKVWLEDPGYHGARGAFLAAGARIVNVGVDAEGIDVAEGRRRAKDARGVFVCPSRQMPLTTTMTLPRRMELLRWAAEAGAWIVEDDYDSEFRYASRPIPALQGIDIAGCVVYTGTFSKVAFPALRLGYLVVPESLVDAFVAARHYTDYQSPYLEQAVMAEFMAAGHFERHIRRMRAIYRERHDIMVEALRRYVGGALRVDPADSGMALRTPLGALRGPSFGNGKAPDVVVADAAERVGLDVVPLTPMGFEHHVEPALLLGYSGLVPADIEEGARKLGDVMERLTV